MSRSFDKSTNGSRPAYPTRYGTAQILVLTMLGLFCTGSQCIGNVANPIIHNASLEIQTTLQNITNEPTVWLAQLQQLEEKLRVDGSNWADDVGQIAQRAIGAAGTTVRCTVDFTGRRVAMELQALLARINGQLIPAAPPTVCTVSLEQISLGRIPTTVTFYGYDLRPSELSANVVSASGTARPITDLMTAASEYAVTINLSGNRANLRCDDQQMALRHEGKDVPTQTNTTSAIPITWPICPPSPPPPPRRPPHVLLSRPDDCGGGLTGCRTDRTYGGPCTTGYERQECQVIKRDGGGHCEMVRWNGDPSNCSCTVHYGANAFDGVACDIKIVEIGVQQPAPPPPPCACRNGVLPQ
jgi:hypothetical protein